MAEVDLNKALTLTEYWAQGYKTDDLVLRTAREAALRLAEALRDVKAGMRLEYEQRIQALVEENLALRARVTKGDLKE